MPPLAVGDVLRKMNADGTVNEDTDEQFTVLAVAPVAQQAQAADEVSFTVTASTRPDGTSGDGSDQRIMEQRTAAAGGTNPNAPAATADEEEDEDTSDEEDEESSPPATRRR